MREALELTDLIADIGILFAGAGAIIFVISYATFFNWRATPAGRALMYVFIAMASVALLAGAGRWLGPDYWGREFFRPATWWSVAITIGHLIHVLWASWRKTQPVDIPSRARKEQP